jgi:hypothetical protein
MAPKSENQRSKIAMILFCYFLFETQLAHAQLCTASGLNSAGASMSVASGGGDLSINNTDNSFVSDNNYATATTLVSFFNGQTSNLQSTDFGFSIPATAIICGIQAELEKSATNIGFVSLLESYVTDLNVKIMKNGTAIGANKATSDHWTTTDTYTTYGGTNDKWGTTWLPADINSSNFGIFFSAHINDLAGLMPVVRIDHIRITVYYYDPGVLTVPLTNFNVWNSNNNTAFLQWKTIDQYRSARILVERSTNAASWEPLTGIPQKDLFNQMYSYTDTRPLPGRSFYRLKMVTASGEIKYSESRNFVLTYDSKVKCFPNPFTSYIQLSGVKPGEHIVLTNIYGQRVPLPPVTGHPFQIDVSSLDPGVYFINVGNTRMKIQKR